MNDTQLHSFMDEMEKISRSVFKDFMGGIDPTGGSTFQYGMRDAEQAGKGSSFRRGVGTVGGLVGGAAVVPAGIGGLIGAVKGLGSGKSLGGRLLSAGRGFMSGAASPFKQVYHASRAKRALGTAAAGRAMSDAELRAVHGFAKTLPGQKLIRAAEGAARKGTAFAQDHRVGIDKLREAAGHLSPELAGKLQKQVGGRLNSGLATLGTSGAIGAGSAYLQYGKGQQAAQRYMGQGLRPQEQ